MQHLSPAQVRIHKFKNKFPFFLTVGGGTAGCLLARRLSENGKFSVLLLEAGGIPKDGMDVPAMAPNFIFDPSVTFQYKSVPQKAGLAHGGVKQCGYQKNIFIALFPNYCKSF